VIDYYGIETSPRKLEPEYAPARKTTKIKQVPKAKAKVNQKAKVKNTKSTTIKIIDVAVCFAVLLVISYRYALINLSFEEKESLKKNLANVQKQNEQLKVSIEQKLNVNTIEQEAKEKLGMQKLDNNQKVYVNLQKSDYIEVASKKDTSLRSQTWWSKLLKDLLNIN